MASEDDGTTKQLNAEEEEDTIGIKGEEKIISSTD